MDWRSDLLSRLPTGIQSLVAFPTRFSIEDLPGPPPKKAKFAASSSRSTVDSVPLQPRKSKGQINDQVYEFAGPVEGPPSIELVFFHGLQPKTSHDSQEADVVTWRSEDGKELWLDWIVGKSPKARILCISYGAHAEKTEKEKHLDMYNLTENLLSDLTQAEVGQNKCPVVLVGHSIGGLVMKELCLSATGMVARKREMLTKPVQNFLDNLNGLFFYSTPHLGTRLAEKTNLKNGCLFEDLEPLNGEAARKREEFCELRGKKSWKTYGIVESKDTVVGKFKGIVVPEASARCDVDELYTVPANHFDICRPRSRNSSSFIKLIRFIDSAIESHIPNAESSHTVSIGLAQHPVGLKTRAEKVQELLKGGGVLGIFGMGGIGKTTLAREVFNMMSKDFEYTCFVDNVKGFKINDLRKSVLEQFYHKGKQLRGATPDWNTLKGKETLLVMDDIDSETQLKVLPHWEDFGSGSCLILTSRHKRIFKFYQSNNIYDVEFLDTNEATELFCKHAFGSRDIPQDKSEPLRKNVKAVVKKCGGLPLTLEVMGRYLCDKSSNEEWEDTIGNLREATAVDGGRNEDDQLWAALELSYNKLSEEAQDMFCDAATFFFEMPLDTFLAAWSEKKAKITWDNLVDRALVKEVSLRRSILGGFRSDDNTVWVHEQLRDLAKRHVKSTILSNSTHGKGEIVELLNENKVNSNTKILRLDGFVGSNTLRFDSFVRLNHLKYMEMIDFRYEGSGRGLTRKLRLLIWRPLSDHLFQISLMNMKNLAVLEIGDGEVPVDFPKALETLVSLRRLEVSFCTVPEGFNQALGHLKNLEILSLNSLEGPGLRDKLPENFGNLSQLKAVNLAFEFVILPATFGQLKKLADLRIQYYDLETLCDGFGGLSSLKYLEFSDCGKLSRLPDSFGQLSTLEHLEFSCSFKLSRLPDSFGKLSALKYLKFGGCLELCLLPDSFGQLSTLERLEFDCEKLSQLPDSFGHLSALKYLTFKHCHKLCVLPDSLGQLSALEHLEFRDCRKLSRLPDSFGHLSALKYLKFEHCHELCVLPDSFGQLSTLKHLEFHRCYELPVLPNSFGGLSSLRHLEFISCIKLQSLPETFSRLPNLQYLKLQYLASFKNIPDCIESLQSLHTLELAALPCVRDLPPWLGETRIIPIGLVRLLFQIRDGQFSLIEEGDPWSDYDTTTIIDLLPIPSGDKSFERSECQFWFVYERAMLSFSKQDYKYCREILCKRTSGLVLRPWLQGLLLQLMGMLKLQEGDLTGALNDLTSALGMFSEGTDLRSYAYLCRKERGWVNFLLGNFEEAQKDYEMVVTLHPESCRDTPDLKGKPLHGELVANMLMLSILKPSTYPTLTTSAAIAQVIKMVRQRGYLRALAVWYICGVNQVRGIDDQAFYLQEMGILKRLASDLQGALEDLTAALEVDPEDYECLKHRAYVKHLLKDEHGARLDAERCLAMGREQPGDTYLGETPVRFLEFDL
ncbi:unnamed protein product [Calypogeia fissa]